MNTLIENAKKYFPDLQIKYKNQSFIMKILATLMFFNKGFMTHFTNTFGSTIYFPNESFTKDPINFTSVFLHELVHVHDFKKHGSLLYSFLYGFPQILFLLCIPLFFFYWKIALILSIICLLPIPAYFRMVFEKRAYLCSLYVLNYLYKKYHLISDTQQMLNDDKEFYCQEFFGSSYYFMWPFKLLKYDFDKGLNRIKAGLRPYDDEVFDMIDDLLSKV